MASYMIGYDLNRPGQNYPELFNAIKAISGWWWQIQRGSCRRPISPPNKFETGFFRTSIEPMNCWSPNSLERPPGTASIPKDRTG